jgi:hypothetical protein
LVVLATAIPLGLPLGVHAQTPELPLVAHHATYRLSLASATGSKAPAAVNGAISYDFSGSACDGYAMVFRQMTEMQPPEGEAVVSDMHSTTFEGGDAKLFRFDTKTTFGASDKEDDVDGKAVKGADGSVSIDLQKPQPAKTNVSSALFPTEHLRKIIEAAKQGQKTLSEPVYDGSETGQKLYDTFTVIGAALTSPTQDGSAGVEALKDVRRWPVTISYFEHGQNDAQPAYIMSFELFENGISRALKLDYGAFSLAGELQELKLLPGAKDCKTH